MRRQSVLASAVSGATPPCSLLLLCLNLLAEMRGVYSSSPSRPSTGVMPPNSKGTGGARLPGLAKPHDGLQSEVLLQNTPTSLTSETPPGWTQLGNLDSRQGFAR